MGAQTASSSLIQGRRHSNVESIPPARGSGVSGYLLFRFAARSFARPPRRCFADDLAGHPASITAYASSDTVRARFARLCPAFLRRVMFATSEFFGAAFVGAAFFGAAFFGAAFFGAATPFLDVCFAAAPAARDDPFRALGFRAGLARLVGVFLVGWLGVFLDAISRPMRTSSGRRGRARPW